MLSWWKCWPWKSLASSRTIWHYGLRMSLRSLPQLKWAFNLWMTRLTSWTKTPGSQLSDRIVWNLPEIAPSSPWSTSSSRTTIGQHVFKKSPTWSSRTQWVQTMSESSWPWTWSMWADALVSWKEPWMRQDVFVGLSRNMLNIRTYSCDSNLCTPPIFYLVFRLPQQYIIKRNKSDSWCGWSININHKSATCTTLSVYVQSSKAGQVQEWWGCSGVAGLHQVRQAHQWWPQRLPGSHEGLHGALPGEGCWLHHLSIPGVREGFSARVPSRRNQDRIQQTSSSWIPFPLKVWRKSCRFVEWYLKKLKGTSRFLVWAYAWGFFLFSNMLPIVLFQSIS